MGSLEATLFLLPLLLGAAAAQISFFKFDPFISDPIRGPGPGLEDQVKEPEYDTAFGGNWELISENAGVSSMHIVINHNGKAIMFDDTNLGPSALQLPRGKCRPIPKNPKAFDCFAHAIEFDPDTGRIRPLRVLTDTWCSSGAFAPDGTLVQTGGWQDGDRAVRYIGACDTCDWIEYPTDLAEPRWYATQQILPNGAMVVIGGRRSFSYEYVPPPGKGNVKARPLAFLEETTDQLENNLYPFVHLNTDGNLFVFANDRAILLNPETGATVRRYPPLRGGARNYPGTGMSALLPLSLRDQGAVDANFIYPTEVIVCGGSNPEAFRLAEKGNFPPAIQSCGRIRVNDPNPKWEMEQMPMPRTMSDLLILPNAELLLINGASRGCAGWWFARDPVFNPVLYRPDVAPAKRFKTLTASAIPRMYHATSAVLPDASVLVAGSNTNDGYKFVNVLYPTELRVEKFYPPYFDRALGGDRPVVGANALPQVVRYGQEYGLGFSLSGGIPLVGNRVSGAEDVKVTMYAPPFTTHGFSMNQRLLVLKTEGFMPLILGQYQVTVTMPPSGKVAPPGYYMLFVVHRGIPSEAIWVRIMGN